MGLDGKIVVAGESESDDIAGNDDTAPNIDFAVARYNTNGSLDMTFNGIGKVTTNINYVLTEVTSVAVQSDGKIVVVGNRLLRDFVIARYSVTGMLDTSFGGTGKVTTDFGGRGDEGHSVAVQSDGKIVVAGNSDVFGIAVVRYTSSGSLDASFNVTGKVTTSIGTRKDLGTSVVIQNDGKIVVAGSSFNGAKYDFAVVRYNSNGSLDADFNATGKVTTSIGRIDDYGTSVAVQKDGKIVVAGQSVTRISSENNLYSAFALVRYNSDGGLIVIAGHCWYGEKCRFVVARY